MSYESEKQHIAVQPGWSGQTFTYAQDLSENTYPGQKPAQLPVGELHPIPTSVHFWGQGTPKKLIHLFPSSQMSSEMDMEKCPSKCSNGEHFGGLRLL